MTKQTATGERNWYAIHTYAGYENAVARNLKQRIESLGMEDKIFSVIVPTEKKIKIKAGKRVEEEEKIYPGYVLVDMIVTDDSWYVVRNTPRVTGFVGSGVSPVPLDPKEVETLFGAPISYQVHDISEVRRLFPNGADFLLRRKASIPPGRPASFSDPWPLPPAPGARLPCVAPR